MFDFVVFKLFEDSLMVFLWMIQSLYDVESLFWLVLFKVEMNGIFFENKCVNHNCEDLEGNLNAIKHDPEPRGVESFLILLVGDAEAQKHANCNADVDADVQRGAPWSSNGWW